MRWALVKFLRDDSEIAVECNFIEDYKDAEEIILNDVYNVFWSSDESDTPESVLKRDKRILHIIDNKKSKFKPFKAGWYKAIILQTAGSRDELLSSEVKDEKNIVSMSEDKNVDVIDTANGTTNMFPILSNVQGQKERNLLNEISSINNNSSIGKSEQLENENHCLKVKLRTIEKKYRTLKSSYMRLSKINISLQETFILKSLNKKPNNMSSPVVQKATSSTGVRSTSISEAEAIEAARDLSSENSSLCMEEPESSLVELDDISSDQEIISCQEAPLTYPCRIPEFSREVRKFIEEGVIMKHLNRFVREAATFFRDLRENPTRYEYDVFCQTLANEYPFLYQKDATGRPSYNFFKKRLTSSIRNTRYYRKKSDRRSSSVGTRENRAQSNENDKTAATFKELKELFDEKTVDSSQFSEDIMQQTSPPHNEMVLTLEELKDFSEKPEHARLMFYSNMGENLHSLDPRPSRSRKAPVRFQ